jgi:HPt (histidine-containing phosphotransfer) domain-containing protein
MMKIAYRSLRRLLLFWSAAIVLVDVASAEVSPVLTLESQVLPIGTGTKVFVDSSREMTFEQVQQAWSEGRFEDETKAVPNYGFTGFAYWFHFEIRDSGRVQGPWFFSMESPLVDFIDLYYRNTDGTWVHKASGDRLPFEERGLKHRFFYFPLPLSSDQPTAVFVRMQTQGASQFVMSIQSQAAVSAEDHESQLAQGAFIGLMAIMIAYYLLMAIGARSLEYLSLSLHWSGILLFKLVINGLAYEYLWPRSPWWGNVASAFSVPFVFLMAGFATYKFLGLSDYRRTSKIFKVLLSLLAIGTLGSFVLPYSTLKIFLAIGLCTVIAILVTSVYTLLSGYQSARFFLLSWISIIVASLVYGLQKSGLLPVSFLTTYSVEIGAAIHVLLMAIGASDKINAINMAIRRAQKEALEAQIEARRLTETMNIELERQVKERTEELWQQTKGMSVMLDNIQQGICTIDGGGSIHPQYSQFLERVVGTKDLSGKSLYEVLFDRSDLSAEDRSQLRTAIGFSMGQDSLGFEGNQHLLPRQMKLQSAKGSQYLEVDWAPIEGPHGDIQKILAAVRDITSVKKAEEAAAARQHELEIIGQILEIPASKFKRFISSTSRLLDDCEQIVQAGPRVIDWPVLLRNIHTIKGNARTYSFHELSQVTHEVETDLFTFDLTQAAAAQHTQLQHQLARIRTLIQTYEQVHDIKLKRKDQAELELNLMKLSQLVGPNLAALPEEPRHQLARVLGSLDRFSANSFGTILRPLVSSLDGLAKMLGRQVPEVRIEGQDFYLDVAGQERIEDIFVHLFRNSLDHGFDPDLQGQITIQIEHTGDATRLIYQDNGSGLNLKVLKEKGLRSQHIHENASEEAVANLIFLTGISSATKVTEISGRGVGMEAVKAFIESLGGTLQLKLTGMGPSPDYRRFSLTLQLPPQIQVNESRELSAAQKAA